MSKIGTGILNSSTTNQTSTYGDTGYIGTTGTTTPLQMYTFTDNSSTLVLTNGKKFSEYQEINHNNGFTRDLYLQHLDQAISKLRTLNYKPNKIITNHDTLMRIQQMIEIQVGQIKMEDKERTEQLLLFTLLAADVENGILTAYRGLEIVIDKVPTDVLSRIYVCEDDRAGIEIRDLK